MYKKFGVVVLSFIVSLVFTVQAFAAEQITATTNFKINIESGGFDVKAPTPLEMDFGSLTIDGRVHTLKVDMDEMIIRDFRGVGDGWTIYVAANQFMAGTDNILPEGSLKMDGIDIKAVNSSKELTAVDGQSIHVSNEPIYLDMPGQHMIAKAEQGFGMGEYEVTFQPLELTLDTSKIFLGNYKTTITYDIVTGP